MSSGQKPLNRTSSKFTSLEDYDSAPVDNDAQPNSASLPKVIANNQIAFDTNSGGGLAEDELPGKGHRSRNSGGFLLQTLPTENARSRALDSAEPELSYKARGKRRVENGDLYVQKRVSLRQKHRQKASLGSSPLAIEVSNAQPSDRSDPPLPRSSTSTQPDSTGSVRSSLKSTDATDDARAESNQQRRVSALGVDTDPVQIVNLALNLSESRRRNFSTGGFVAHRDSVGGRRLVSPAQTPLGLSNGASGASGGSLKQYLNQQRHASRNVSPRSRKSAGSQGGSPQIPQEARQERRKVSALPDLRAGINEDVISDLSDATLARAEKARVAIELSYEYRRLLQWLPKLPTPVSNTSIGGQRLDTNAGNLLGRVYNPLQYIRNRKVRLREERALDSEAQGWTNTESVRSWVDTVIDEREDGVSRVDCRFPLPSFEPSNRGLVVTDEVVSLGTSQYQTKKVARPHNIWEFSSWDLLADCYWLSLEDNVTRIEDPHGRRLFTGDRPPKADRPRTSKDSLRYYSRRSGSLVRSTRSPEKIRKSVESLRNESIDRGRQQRKIHEHRSPTFDDDGSPIRKSRWPRRFGRSRSPSSSSESKKRRKPVRGASYLNSRDEYESAVLEKHMMDILAKEAEESKKATKESPNQAAAEMTVRTGAAASPTKATTTEISKRRPNAPQRLKTDMPAVGRRQISPRASFDEERLVHHRMSSDDFGSTAPNSPTTHGFVPSISINLSPPASPPISAVSTRKIMPAGLASLRRNRSPNRSLQAISDNEFALDSGTSTDVSRQTTSESQLVNMLRQERPSESSNGLLSPTKVEFFSRGHRQSGSITNRNLKDVNPSDSRIRGLFKGGRIAEIVGSEVSKVGDMLWRKDQSNNPSVTNSPSASTYGSEDSEMDDGDVSGLDNSPEDSLIQTGSRKSDRERLSQGSVNGEKPRFYMSNLPTFRSTVDRKEPRSPTEPPSNHDHITRQQVAMRDRGRSSRFDRLAPPKIDMRGISPTPFRPTSPDRTGDRSRHSSSSRPGHRVRSADRRLNQMLDMPGQIMVHEPAPTGLSALASKQFSSRGRPTIEDKRQWSISDRSVSTVRGAVTKRDIARVRALLLSSGVKANEIVRRGDEIPVEPSPFLQDIKHLFNGEIPHLPRSQEYNVAGRTLINSTDTSIQDLRNAAEHFSNTTVEDLQEQLKSVSDHVNRDLTHRVRTAADDADAFSTQLTTTHTLSVKQLNDSINNILRQRRRRLRWIRRTGWTIVEWTLLGIMWLVWVVVVIVRLVRGIVKGIVGAVRWVLWL